MYVIAPQVFAQVLPPGLVAGGQCGKVPIHGPQPNQTYGIQVSRDAVQDFFRQRLEWKITVRRRDFFLLVVVMQGSYGCCRDIQPRPPVIIIVVILGRCTCFPIVWFVQAFFRAHIHYLAAFACQQRRHGCIRTGSGSSCIRTRKRSSSDSRSNWRRIVTRRRRRRRRRGEMLTHTERSEWRKKRRTWL